MRGTQGQSYGAIDSITDPKLKGVLIQLLDRVNSLQGRPGDQPTFRQSINLDSNKATNAADPEADGDLVTLRYLKAHNGIHVIRQQLQASGVAPIDLTGLVGVGGTIVTGTHAERIQSTPASANSFFYETDRRALYSVVAGNWFFAVGTWIEGLLAGIPGDLNAADEGFEYFAIDTGLMYRWSGGAWYWQSGVLRGPIASRPAVFTQVVAGTIYIATDRNMHAWQLDYAANAWVLLKGWGNPFPCTLSPDTKPALGVDDAGFRIVATDFNREYTWTGAAWTDSPAQETRLAYVDFQGAAPATPGWVIADGALHANGLSTAAGGVVNITPNNVPNFYVRA